MKGRRVAFTEVLSDWKHREAATHGTSEPGAREHGARELEARIRSYRFWIHRDHDSEGSDTYTECDARRFAPRLRRCRESAPGAPPMRRVGIRWTIGDVSEQGFEALQCSIWGAWNAFGPDTAYAVCVNTVSLDRARALTGAVPEAVRWHWVARDLPAFLVDHVDAAMAEGVAWKITPLRMFPDRYEISLDNDCILWDVPDAIRSWLA